MKDEALRLALEALRHFEKAGLATLKTIDAITVIKQALAQTEPEPAIYPDEAYELGLERIAYYTSPPKREPLTEREIELLDGMIEVQMHHAEQCDGIANRTMAEKQKGWDMERVALLQKLKAAHGIKGEA